MDALATTGLPIHLTELDIDGTTDLIQLREYQRVFPIFWEHPAVEGITLWGFRYGLWRTDQGAYLITQGGSERLAMTWLKAYVNDTLTLTQSIEVHSSDDNDTLSLDDTVQMSTTVLPYNTTIPNVTWSVTPSGIATINSSGLLTPVTNGKVTVKATAWDGSGKTGTRNVWFTNRLVDSIAVSSADEVDTITLAETLQMQATILPENATNPGFVWSVSPDSRAQISSGGLLTPTAIGTVTVVATAIDGSGVTDSMDIVIENIPVGLFSSLRAESILVYPNPATGGKFTIQGIDKVTQVMIRDVYGRSVNEYLIVNESEKEVHINALPGIYIISFSDGQQTVHKKILVE
jgi:hypothetical protein